MPSVRKAVLPVAGFGARVLPASKSIPKEMLPVFDMPVLHYNVREAVEAGIEHFVFVTGRNKGVIEDYFDHAFELETSLAERGKQDLLEAITEPLLPPGSMSFVRQQVPAGLGHAIWCARDIIGEEPFAVLLPDVPIQASPSCLAQMQKAYEKTGGNLLAVEEVPPEDVEKYGIIDPAQSFENGQSFEKDKTISERVLKIKDMVEKPSRDATPSHLAITGRYILQPEIFDILGKQARGAGGEIQLTDAMARLRQDQAFYAYRYEGRSYDCGSKLGYLEAFVAYALHNPRYGKEARNILDKLLK